MKFYQYLLEKRLMSESYFSFKMTYYSPFQDEISQDHINKYFPNSTIEETFQSIDKSENEIKELLTPYYFSWLYDKYKAETKNDMEKLNDKIGMNDYDEYLNSLEKFDISFDNILQSGMLKMIPKNIQNVKYFIKDMNRKEMFTNKNCYFKLSLFWPNEFHQHYKWMIVNLVYDKNIQNLLPILNKYHILTIEQDDMDELKKDIEKRHIINSFIFKNELKFEWNDYSKEKKVNEIYELLKTLTRFFSWFESIKEKEEIKNIKKIDIIYK